MTPPTQAATAVPALNRGLAILRMLRSPSPLEELISYSGVPKSSLLRILAVLRQEGLVERDPVTRLYQSTVVFARNPEMTHTYIVPGDLEWQLTPGPWWLLFRRGNTPHMTTYGARGDDDMGVMWRFLPRDNGLGHLRFSVHGGHAEVMLVEGPEPIPVTGNIPAIHKALVAGKYGRVLETVRGLDSNERVSHLNFDLSVYGDKALKFVIIDALEGSWGFVSVSRLTMW